MVSEERSWEVRAARIYISSDRGVCAKIRAFYMLQRLYFAFRIRLKPFGRAEKKNNLKFYSENAGKDSVAPFRRAPHNFSRSPKGATQFFPLSEGRHRILWHPSEGIQQNSKGKVEALRHVKRSYLSAHTSVRANIYLRSSNFSRSFFWYQI